MLAGMARCAVAARVQRAERTLCRGLFFNPAGRGRIKRRCATHANSDAEIRGQEPHDYRQETAPQSFKTSKLQCAAEGGAESAARHPCPDLG